MPSQPWRPSSLDRFLIGVCHYPEQEPRALLETDAALMAEAGIEVVRLGEFAWNVIEPEEGRFDFDLFDEAIRVFAAHGIDTLFCTPTATPPRWLSKRHPEILRVDASGRSMRHGSRQHADVTSPVMRDYSRRITQALADHYCDNPHVIGWQTDNEFNTHFSETHSEAANAAFRIWLESRYSTIDALNEAWGTTFWNRTYDDFGDVETPINDRPAAADPSHVLDYRRFLADATRTFQRDQVEILRRVQPRWFVFHNIGRINDLDPRALGEDVDVMGVDLYPLLRDEFTKIGLGYTQALQLDVFRGWCGSFIVPELQQSAGAHPGLATSTPEPGELERYAMSAVARGADGLIWFRWTSARFGAEAYWMGVLDHDRKPRRRFQELKAAIASLKALRGDLAETVVDQDVVILGADWENELAHATYSLGLPGVAELALPLHHHCYARNIPCGFASPADDFTRAKVAFVPHLPVWDEAWTPGVEAFVEAGGVLVVGARSATRDRNNHVLTETPPGPLADLCGVEIVESGRLPAPGANALLSGPIFQVERTSQGRAAESARRRHFIEIPGGEPVEAAHGYEVLAPSEGTEVLARWSSRFLAGQPAATRRRRGLGSVVYIGAFLTPELTDRLLGPILAEAGASPILAGAPYGVEITTRSKPGLTLTFVQNTTGQTLDTPSPEGAITLEPYETRVFSRET